MRFDHAASFRAVVGLAVAAMAAHEANPVRTIYPEPIGPEHPMLSNAVREKPTGRAALRKAAT